ncbi:MAG: type II secretion system protein [Butyrivibrio sp.]|jgi:prepilin-type N-terminal cleavage/methylation domain-containing protein|nr:type II secretion system protein [Lachnospiraceae bacterium]MBQ2609461.1 type II secretion system protein [Butyrivibrio sp.]MEE3417161.1 type II secretion system protein [Prevotella sp.]
MRRLYKRHSSRRGFSLLEVLIVVAIIVTLAGVVGVGVAGLIRTANRSNDAVVGSSESLSVQISNSESVLKNYNFAKT